MSTTKLILFATLVVFIFGSCSEIIEVSLSSEKVQLNSPTNASLLNKYTQVFWWEKVKNATRYSFQIASPNFDSIVTLHTDSLLSTNKLTLNLSPGKYEWRVRAENNSSTSDYTTWSFIVDTASIITQKVLLKTPLSETSINTNNIIFSWNELFGSDRYLLQIDTIGFTDTSNILFSKELTGNSFLYKLPAENQYQWRVKAYYNNQNSLWSDIYHLNYDITPPESVNLLSPGNNLSVSLPVVLNWSTAQSAIKYVLYVYNQDSATIFHPTFPLQLNTTSYNFNLGSVGTKLVWRVKSIDKAGNESAFSTYRTFVIK